MEWVQIWLLAVLIFGVAGRSLDAVKHLTYVTPTVSSETVAQLQVTAARLNQKAENETKIEIERCARELGVSNRLASCLSVVNGELRVDREAYLGTNTQCGSWKAHFIGSGALKPSESRKTSSMALQIDSGKNCGLMLFDCGEGTLGGMEPLQRIHLANLQHIFITHLHGDHIFGLPGVILAAHQAQASKGKEPFLNIFGPKGLAGFLACTFKSSFQSRTLRSLRVHEMILGASNNGRDGVNGVKVSTCFPQPDKVFHLVEAPGYSVKAAPIEHTVPTVGYVVQEAKPPPRLGHTESHLRKVAFCQDTSDATAISELVAEADLLVHDATVCTKDRASGMLCKRSEDVLRRSDESEAVKRGHSTPDMAARFAKQVDAHELVLTHISQAWPGSNRLRHFNLMTQFENVARQTMEHARVTAAFDGFFLTIQPRDQRDRRIGWRKLLNAEGTNT